MATDLQDPASIECEQDLARAITALRQLEPRFGELADRHGLPDLRRREPGLASLLFLVTEQQISLIAAAAIWQRFAKAFSPFEATILAASDLEAITACGQSLPKARTIKSIATAIVRGELDLAALERLDDDQARSRLCAIHGIGPWTAENYLLSCLGRRDAWPSGDIALKQAACDVFGLDARPDNKQMQKLAEPWRPWRSIAARLLWTEYRHTRQMK